MKRERGKNPTAFSATDYPELREFFSAYMHEDFCEEYGSAAGAASAYCGDASLEQVAQAREEWARLRQCLAGRAIAGWQEALGKLGGSWRPQAEEELRSLDEVFSSKV
ncbi:MAG: hypothetical protein PVS2B2_05200 [Candidatus Acidiferrum sp.]